MCYKAIVTLSFDDGRSDNYRIVNDILIQNSIPATFNIATGFIENKCEIGNMHCLPLTKEELFSMATNPLFEIAAHGDMHKNDFDDINEGRKKLISWLRFSEDKKIGFASPGSGMTMDFIKDNKEKLKSIGFSYIRTGLRINCCSAH